MLQETGFQQNSSQIEQEWEKTPNIHRRKADEITRIYVCQFKKCQKSYGSYPALYTHIKLKHSTQSKKGSNKLPAKNLKYIKRISPPLNCAEISTTQSTPQLKESTINKGFSKLEKKSLPELYEDLLLNLHLIESIQQSKIIPGQGTQTGQSLEEFPSIQMLNEDILNPLRNELISLKSPQTFARNSASTAGIAHKLAELLAYLGPLIKQELYSEFCYFLGFFAKCIKLRKIQSMEAAQEDLEEIYQYIHDSIGYCTTFKFRFLKNGKVTESRDQISELTKIIIMIISQLTFSNCEEKEIPPFVLA